MTAPVGELTTPIRRGSIGSGRLRAGSKSPSFSSFALRSSNACWSEPLPSGSRTCAESWYSPRGGYTRRVPRARTFIPSRGLNLTSRASVRHTTARICAPSSLSEKYQWPDGAILRFETSPSTHTSRNSVSRTPWMRSVSSETVSARGRAGRGWGASPKSRPFCCIWCGHSDMGRGPASTAIRGRRRAL